jgi:hypothetical protein
MAKLLPEFKQFAEASGSATTSRSGAAADAALATKVEALYKMVQRVESTAEALPEIVARLRTLQTLHAEGALFTQRLHALDASAAEAQRMLLTDKELLATVEASFAANVATIEGNISLLDERVAKVAGAQ